MEVGHDPVKREAMLREGVLNFAEAAGVFDGPAFEFEDVRFDDLEWRYCTIGLPAERMVVIVWATTERGRRVVSMRKANEREQARFRSRLA